MKFFCHITVLDEKHARITFAVMRLAENVFEASPVQNSLPCTFPLYSKITLTRGQKSWKHKFEDNNSWIREECIKQILNKLKEKLAGIKVVA